MTVIASSGASLIFLAQNTVKNSGMKGPLNRLLGMGPSNGYSAFKCLTYCGDVCFLEPYMPSRFTRKFEYDQLYVGNPNIRLGHIDSLIDDT